jgi:hypothetical protein
VAVAAFAGALACAGAALAQTKTLKNAVHLAGEPDAAGQLQDVR